MTWTVPTIDPVSSSAEITTRSPRATPAAAPRQNNSAFARDIGSMKLTDAPPSTQSISTSLSPSISRSPMVCRGRISIALATSSPRGASVLGCQHDDISRGLARAVAERRRLVEQHRQAVVLGEAIRRTAERDLETALQHPDLLMNAGVARAAFIRHVRACRQYDLDDLERRGKIG